MFGIFECKECNGNRRYIILKVGAELVQHMFCDLSVNIYSETTECLNNVETRTETVVNT